MNKIDANENDLGANGDAFYEMLMQAHDGLSEDESHALNIRLVLLFANHIADVEKLRSLLESAGEKIGSE